MPFYIFQNPETGEVREVLQKMTEPHEYKEEGVKWQRLWTSPNASIDTQIDPLSSKDFVEKTRNKKGTLGEIWDAAKEGSKKREEIMGKDPVKEKYFKDYSKKRQGVVHQHDPRKKNTPRENRANPFEII
ncbi:hypothetical protein CMI37_33650 [Candidatus Pacearchaeota archaeon]|nr:hypothetical protein [Candidatus Pacearchaeota archaeon]|tara:strand:+ start:1688 stop:2077 length:390 start_codon:yes stop_codon:yes gene_type:complete